MDLLTQLANTYNVIDVTNEVLSEDAHLQNSVHAMFQELVSEIRFVIESKQAPIIKLANSNGKDSNIVVLATFEAYRQAINENTIEASRPLLISTVDTKIESLPMHMFCNYAKDKIETYARKVGINLSYSTISPSLSSEYFIKWGSADKLINNPLRTGDCTPILKVDPSLKHLALLRQTICKDKRVVTITGQRLEESARRAANMKKQKVASKTANDLVKEFETLSINKSVNYAPIFAWSTEDVFALLRIAGTSPMERLAGKSIPAYYENFALLLEIYGRATQETCQISISEDDKVKSTGCGGSSQRFGCHFCTQITEDKSTIQVSEKTYWKVLGTENALRVRDWLFRISLDPNARTHQPKAIDPVMNRIAFQPNVLKSKHLEKMVRYASQLTVDSMKGAEHLASLVEQGREHEHEGYAAIVADKHIHPKAKKAFLEMYLKEATKPLMEYFSDKHAVLLSFKWSLVGVHSIGYRPLAIWADTVEGIGRIPYPKLNSELPAELSTLKPSPALEPIVLSFHTKEFESNFLKEGQPDFLSFWQKPVGIEDMWSDIGGNSSVDKSAAHTYDLKAEFDLVINHKKNAYGGIDTAITTVVNKVKDNQTGRALPAAIQGSQKKQVADYLEQKALTIIHTKFSALYTSLVNAYAEDDAEKIAELSLALSRKMSKNFTSSTVPMRHFKAVTIDTGFKSDATKVEAGHRFTRRVSAFKTKDLEKDGKVKKTLVSATKTTTRCKFYAPSLSPIYEAKFKSTTQISVPDFKIIERDPINTLHYLDNIEGDVEAYNIDMDKLDFWFETGGHLEALKRHDNILSMNIKHRAYYRKNGLARGIRKYDVSEPLKRLMRDAGVSINPTYAKQFQKTLRRSHLFAEVGAFELQGKSREELLAYRGTMTMAQHRQDKARYLLDVRAIRNNKRAELKVSRATYQTNPAKFALNTTKQIMSDFFAIANEQLTLLNSVDMGTYGAMGYSLDGVEGKTQCSAYNAWFGFYHASLSDYTQFKTLLLSQVAKANLSEAVLSEISLANAFDKQATALAQALKSSDRVNKEISSLFKVAGQKEKSHDKLLSKMKTKEKSRALSSLLIA
ncbi:phosphoadenosine phosphosulfate reductase family protein [Psychromonas sp. SP041]|uniref:phosphoadenosine phosphosulfate reductase domain-containing protein n=1 Tax=Psychromonas sp. SP041 TaxID=1365007 RepID=UPI000419561E|nr:phosphoadenosine phosphosulfate reductase family protein [Psychromonas sp. SP041]